MSSKVDDVIDDAKKLKTSSEKLANEVKEDAAEKVEDLSRKCADLLNAALHAAKDVPAAAAARTKEVAATTDDYVHENPWRAVSIAAGVGLLFGFLLSRK